MKKTFTVLLFLFLIVVGLYPQNNNAVVITGTVVDASTQDPVVQAGIRVLNASDSTYIKGGATNSFGKFSIQVNKGHYIVQTSFLGYTDVFTNVNASKSENSLGKVSLRDDGILLKEAVVTAKAPEIVIKGDTVEYNADSYKVQESAVVEDLIKKMPGAEVDANGKITINGKEVKKILLDGKEFFSDDPKVASKNLPAKMVEKLQVLDRKSDMSLMTGFDDGEEETVINLTVKPGMKEGVFGNAYAGYGNKDRYEANAMVNYMRNNNQLTFVGGANNTNNAGFSDFATTSFSGMRGGPRGLNFGGNNGITKAYNGGINFSTEFSPKFKWGGDIRYGRTDNDVISDSYTRYLATDQRETKKTIGNNIGDNFNVNFKIEWKPDSSTQVIFRPNFTYQKNSSFENSNSSTTTEDITDMVNWGNSKYYSEGDGYELGGNLEVSRQLGKKGRVLSFGISGGFNDRTSDGTNWAETYFYRNDSTSVTDQIFHQKNKGYNWRGYVSYVEPVGRNNFLQLTYSYKKTYTESDKETFKNDYGVTDYSLIDTTSTQRLENNFINQEIGLNFKSQREKYNYTVGFSVQPSKTESWNITHNPEHPRVLTSNDVVNFSPTAQFNYLWSKRRNLRLDYKGTVNQPSVSQMTTDNSDPMNIRYGNPNLDPSFENRLRIRYRNFNPEQASAFMLFGGFSFTTNDIVSNANRDENGVQTTTYENINGNMNANLRMIINRPLRNPKFSINSMSYIAYDRSNGFVNTNKNTANTFNFNESAGLDYRSDKFDLGLKGNFRYASVNNSLKGQTDDNTFNYGGTANTTIYFPYNFTLETDMNYSANSGYTSGYDQSEWLWNASLSKQIFKDKSGTIRFKIYDILQERSNISRTSNVRYVQDVNTNTLNSYFMFHFVYRFQIFKGGAKASDMNNMDGDRDGGRPRGGYGGGSRGNGPPRF